jgi:hypothetical protein
MAKIDTLTGQRVDINYTALPERLQQSLQYYIEHHIQTGGFLNAVLSNDLTEACSRADEDMKYKLYDVIFWLYNEAPSVCWGSPEKVGAWLAQRKV